MDPAQNIQGLPPGAVVTTPSSQASATAVDRSTLPTGAMVTTPGAQPQPTQGAAPSTDTAEQPPDDGFLSGVWENTLGPLYDKFKSDYKENQRLSQEPFLQQLKAHTEKAVMENPTLGGGLKMLWSVVQDAYAEGKKSVASVKNSAANAEMGRPGDAAADFMEAQGHAGAALLPVLGPMAAKAGEHLGGGQPKRGLGNMTGIALQLLLGRSGKNKAAAGGVDTFDEATAARKLIDAVNPHPDAMQTFETNMRQELPRIKQYSEQAGIPLTDRESLIKATEQMGDEYQALYDKQLLEPISNKVASNGKTFLENEQELRRLNQLSDYRPTDAPQKAAQMELKSEAAKLRTLLNNDMAKSLGNGITPEQISEARKIGETVRSIAKETRLAKNIERHSANASERGAAANVHATPHGVYATSGGRLGTKLNQGVNAVFGHPGDKLVKEVFEKYQPDTGGLRRAPNGDIIEAPNKANPKPPAPNVADADAAAAEKKFANRKDRPLPAANLQPRAEGATATIGDQIKAKDAAAASRAQERGAAVEAGKKQSAAAAEAGKKSREAAARAQMEKNRASHGKYKGAVSGLEE